MTDRSGVGQRVSIICFTQNGLQTALRCGDSFGKKHISADIWCKKKTFPLESCFSGVRFLETGLKAWTRERFEDSDAVIFVGAVGIAVRSIAPFIVSKKEDPAVLCIDEQGRYVIPILSGHIGGANEYAVFLAGELHAESIITTATDLNGKFAVDVFARKNDLWISDMMLAKEVSAQLLDGKTIGFQSDLPVKGQCPEELVSLKSADGSICIRVTDCTRGRLSGPAERTDDGEAKERVEELCLVVRNITLGVGCRKGKDSGELESFILEELDRHGLDIHGVNRICSIDLKAQEKAIVDFADKYRMMYQTFTSRQLLSCPGTFEGSSFVASVTGVDNVCERSAVLGSGGGRLLFQKTARDGMTLAAAVTDRRIRF